MQTDQATLVLASLLRSGRRFQSQDLSKAVRQRIALLQELLEEYEAKLSQPEVGDALGQAYLLMNTEPPPGAAADWESAVLSATNKADLIAEAEAWRSFLAECLDQVP